MSTTVQPVAASEFADVLGLVEEYWRFEDLAGYEPARISRQLERLLGDPALGSLWLARAGGRPAGYLLAVYVFSLEHFGLTAEIDEFFVLPSQRGRGLGRALLDAAEAEFNRRGCTNVSLQLGRGNDEGRAFYRARGYRERSGFELLDKMLPDRRSQRER
jgi:GNAT superfamily N-acetyltransferase